METPHNLFQIQTANIYICWDKLDGFPGGPGKRIVVATCPASLNDQIHVDMSGNVGTIDCAWAEVPNSLNITNAWAMIFFRSSPPDPNGLPPLQGSPSPVSGNSSPGTGSDTTRWTFSDVEGAGLTVLGLNNYLCFWFQEKIVVGSKITYQIVPETDPVAFTGVAGPGNKDCGSGSGSGRGFAPGMTFPANWMVQISGLQGPLAELNNVYLIRSSRPSSLTWENGGDSKKQVHVSMKFCERTHVFRLEVKTEGLSLSAEAPRVAPPFGALLFAMRGLASEHGLPRIIATPVSK